MQISILAKEVVHVVLRRQTSSGCALYPAVQGTQRDHSPAGISHKECIEGLVSRSKFSSASPTMEATSRPV